MNSGLQLVNSCRESAAEATFPEEARLLVFDLRSQPHYRLPLIIDGASTKTDRAGRGLFFARPDSADVCVLPADFDREHLSWLHEVGLGPHPSQIHFVSPTEVKAHLLPTVFAQENSEVALSSETTIVPFYVGPDEEALSTRIGKSRYFGTSESVAMAFNDKVSNKELCRRAGLPTVPGLSVTSDHTAHEKAAAALMMFEAFGDIIIRTARGSGGSGIAIIKGEDHDAHGAIASYFSSLGQDESCLIEAFLPVRDSLNIQWGVSESQVTFIGMSSQLLAEGTKHEGNQGGFRFLGDRIPPEFAQAVEGASTLARVAQAMGYKGILGFDFILTDDAKTFCIETNARVNGSTHAHQIVHHLAGRHEEVLSDLSWALLTLDTGLPTFAELSSAMHDANLPLLQPGTLHPETHIIPVEHIGNGRWSLLVVDSRCDSSIEQISSPIVSALTKRATQVEPQL